jgi:hypothetical protein
MSDAPAPPPATNADKRWQFLRDVAVFELKLTLNNLHNFFQVPATLAVALIDLIFKHGEEGSRFYWLVEQGRLIDDHIDIYSIVEHRERAMNKDFTVDAVLKRVEGIIVREYEKGGTAASVKNAVDRVFDEMQTKTAPASQKAAQATESAIDALRQAADAFRAKPGEPLPPEPPQGSSPPSGSGNPPEH